MKVIQNELIVYFDVDETLVHHQKNKTSAGLITNVTYLPLLGNIQQVKMHKLRGYHVTVWSANGYQHALDRVKELHLEEFVDVIKTKPKSYFDDKDASQWMQRAYVD